MHAIGVNLTGDELSRYLEIRAKKGERERATLNTIARLFTPRQPIVYSFKADRHKQPAA